MALSAQELRRSKISSRSSLTFQGFLHSSLFFILIILPPRLVPYLYSNLSNSAFKIIEFSKRGVTVKSPPPRRHLVSKPYYALLISEVLYIYFIYQVNKSLINTTGISPILLFQTSTGLRNCFPSHYKGKQKQIELFVHYLFFLIVTRSARG